MDTPATSGAPLPVSAGAAPTDESQGNKGPSPSLYLVYCTFSFVCLFTFLPLPRGFPLWFRPVPNALTTREARPPPPPCEPCQRKVLCFGAFLSRDRPKSDLVFYSFIGGWGGGFTIPRPGSRLGRETRRKKVRPFSFINTVRGHWVYDPRVSGETSSVVGFSSESFPSRPRFRLRSTPCPSLRDRTGDDKTWDPSGRRDRVGRRLGREHDEVTVSRPTDSQTRRGLYPHPKGFTSPRTSLENDGRGHLEETLKLSLTGKGVVNESIIPLTQPTLLHK